VTPAPGVATQAREVARMRPCATLDAAARRNLYDRAAAIPFGAGHVPIKSLNTE